METEIIYLPEEENKSLVLAATGSPYLLIVHEEGVGARHVIKEKFDYDWLFDFLKDYADENAEFRAALADYIIELSEKV
jgi:hypothetical protein